MNWNKEPILACPEQVDAAIRTHLNDISAACQVLQRGTDAARQQYYLALISRSTSRINNLMYEKELAQRLDNEDTLRANYAELDLVSWCQDTVEQASQLLQQANVSVSFSCREKTLITMADQELLNALLYALIVNAVKAGGEECHVSVRLEHRKSNALLIVDDQGKGFSEKALQRFLNSGQKQLDFTPGAGAGLGLLLCRAIVETHGGRFLLQSSPQGSRCAATLPLRQCGRQHQLNSPLLQIRTDEALTALSDVLPVESFCRK